MSGWVFHIEPARGTRQANCGPPTCQRQGVKLFFLRSPVGLLHNANRRFCRWAASQGVAWQALSPFAFLGYALPSPYGFDTKVMP